MIWAILIHQRNAHMGYTCWPTLMCPPLSCLALPCSCCPHLPAIPPLLLQVLGRLLLMAPGLYGALLEGLPQPASSARFLDRWLHIASTRFLEEVIGVKTMAMLGRYRRRIATAALASVIAADTCPDVLEPLKLVRVVSLSLQVRWGLSPRGRAAGLGEVDSPH